MDETNTEIHFTNTEMDETNTEIIIGNNYKPLDKPNSFSAREKNQTSLNTPAKNENKNFDRPLNENQVGYGVEKPNPISKPTLEAKPSLVATKSNTASDYVSYTSPKNYATEKEWYEALKMTDLMGCIKGGFREIKPFGTDKLRKDYPDMCWELGDNYEI